MVSKDEVIQALKTVYDPEIGMDIWSLGLIYTVEVKKGVVDIVMTFTTPMCPFGPILTEEVKAKIMGLNAKDVHIEVTFDPPWKPSDEIKAALGLGI